MCWRQLILEHQDHRNHFWLSTGRVPSIRYAGLLPPVNAAYK
jgi:hypothetical protein